MDFVHWLDKLIPFSFSHFFSHILDMFWLARQNPYGLEGKSEIC